MVTQKLATPKKNPKPTTPKKRAEVEILINTISKKRTLKLLGTSLYIGNKENQV